jgi:hypothetical protein
VAEGVDNAAGSPAAFVVHAGYLCCFGSDCALERVGYCVLRTTLDNRDKPEARLSRACG